MEGEQKQMAKIIYLFGKVGQTITTQNNGLSQMELRLEQIKKDYYKQLKGKQDTVANYTNYLISQATDIHDAYSLMGY